MNAESCSFEQDQQQIDTWKQYARCRGADPELFYPGRWDDQTMRLAKEVCYGGCPVRRECLAFGLNERQGIWGGFTDRERKAIRRARRLPEPPDRGLDTLLALLVKRETTETAPEGSGYAASHS